MNNQLLDQLLGSMVVEMTKISERSKIAAFFISMYFYKKWPSRPTSRNGLYSAYSGEQRVHSHHQFRKQCSTSVSSVTWYSLTLIETSGHALPAGL